MCATTLAPEPSVVTELILESTLATAHDRWMAEVHRVLLPVTLPEATFWERWDAVSYLAERFPARLRLERALSSELQAFISTEDAERLDLQGERLMWLHRECDRLGREPRMARQLASRIKELLDAVRLWCAEFELATGHISEAAANDDVIRILGRMGGCDIPGWAVAVAG
jgi:hypothetical protein